MRPLIVLSFCLLATPGVSFGLDLPSPPAGYSWEECAEIGGALLKPDGWSYRHLSDKGKFAYFITKEPWRPPEPFDVGLTFNVVFDIPGKSGLKPTEFARRFVATAAATHEAENTWATEMGPFKAEGIVYSGTGETDGFKFFNLVIANDKTGTGYIVIFEAPESNWGAEWSRIEPTIQSLVIDDEY